MPLVVADPALVTRAVLVPFVVHLRKLVQGYEIRGDMAGLAPGLAMAANVLEEGRAAVPTLLEDLAEPSLRARGDASPAAEDDTGEEDAIARAPRPIVRHVPAILERPAPPAAASSGRALVRAVIDRAERTPMDRKILRVLVTRGDAGMTRRQIALAAGLSVRGGAFASTMARLLRSALIVKNGRLLRATHDGAAQADAAPLPVGTALIAHWCESLPEMHGGILTALVRAYPAEVPRQRMAEATGYKPSGGAFAKAIAKLRALGLVDGWRASEDLMRRAGAA
jgi:hypothetical protein